MIVPNVIKTLLLRILSDSQIKVLKAFTYRFLYGNCLPKLAIAFGTDKEGAHFYAKHYQHHFASRRHEKLNLLEIGIGGYKNPNDGGHSLRMWKAYFPKSKIFGIDVYDKSAHDEDRIKTFLGSQTDEFFLQEVAEKIGTIDIIIDDGSHVSEHVICTFKVLFPLLAPNGIYVVEDLQTSYWNMPSANDKLKTEEQTTALTSMDFFKNLVDGLNYEEYSSNSYAPTYFDRHIISMHFYHNLLFIHKGLNNEGSNVLEKRFQ